MTTQMPAKPAKDKIVAGLLAIFLGGIGMHHFYLGNAGRGLLYLLFCWTLIPSLVALFEGIAYLMTPDEKWAAKWGTSGILIQQPGQQQRDAAAQLLDLQKLREAGAITDEEFEAKKKALLG